MDADRLRETLCPLVTGRLNYCTHNTLCEECEKLGLGVPDEDGSKRERLHSALESSPDSTLPVVVERVLTYCDVPQITRNEIQDILWADSPGPEVPVRYRREVARALSAGDMYENRKAFDTLLDKLWVTEPTDFLQILEPYHSLRERIKRYVHCKPEKWDVEQLFDELGVFEAANRRFVLLIEGLASADVRPDESAQRRFVARVNKPLSACGAELRETGIDQGYPLFEMVSIHKGHAARPKNLIFASSVKPDLRFRDAVSNDIEIVTHADKVLVYDLPISNEGLRWSDLQAWWSASRQISDEDEAKKTLYQRLRDCLPSESPPQRSLFVGFYEAFGNAVPNLPALLPEVWLHWDHKTVKERGCDALLRFRMDFLLLLPQGIRVVVEVDGKHHYSDDRGVANSEAYASMVAADRELKLAGYEVFRFGAKELMKPESKGTVEHFFRTMFKRYRVPDSPIW